MSEEPEEIATEAVEETSKSRKRVKLGVDFGEQQTSELADSEARPAKTLRTRSLHESFVTELGTVTGTPQEFPADTADAIVALARKSNVRLVVGDAAQ
jgi:hypothetical protein